MSQKRNVLCIKNNNQYIDETIQYLQSHNFETIILSDFRENGLTDIVKEFERRNDKLDMLLIGTPQNLPRDGEIGEGHDTEWLLSILDEQINGIRNVIDTTIPLLRSGDMKRICLITKLDSSIRLCDAKDQYAEHMVLAGLNMTGKLYFNLLRPEGFTFRWYCATETKGGMSSGEYFLTGLCFDKKEPYQHSDENRFVMRDGFLREIIW